MFGTLIESRALPARRAGSSLASVVIHAALIGGAVLMTARGSLRATVAPDPAPVTVQFHSPKPFEPPRIAKPAMATTTAAAPRALVLETPAIVPTAIPPIDLSVSPTSADFSARRVVSTGILCDRDCTPPGQKSGLGEPGIWSATDVMMRLRDDPVPPRYPESLRRAGIEGTVMVKFIVDTTGRVDMASIEVIRSTHEAFTIAVREAVARLRFNPAVAGDRKVPALAMMPFQFALK